MNRFSKYLSIVTIGASMLCVSGSAIAEEGAKREGDAPKRERPERGPRDGAPGGRLLQAVQELNLTDDQKSQVQAIAAQVREKLEALREQLKDASPEERRAKVQEVLAPMRQELLNVLTEEQKAQLEQKIKDARGKRDGDARRAGPRDGDREKNGPGDGERPRRGKRGDGDAPQDAPKDAD